MATSVAAMTPAPGLPITSATTTSTASAISQALSARNTSRPMPSPSWMVTPGARNFSGASRNEIASTMPSQTKIAATATPAQVSTSSPLTATVRRAR